MKTAIVYYSQSGNVRWVTQQIAGILKADIIELECVKQYPDKGFKKFYWGGKSAVMQETPKLQPYVFNGEEYDRIIDLKFSDGREVVDDEVYIFAVNNYHLGNASGPFADYTTEDTIWSQTDDMGGGFVQDLIAEFLAAETAANGGVAPAPSNWEIVYTGEIVAGEAEGEYIGSACDPTFLKTGDQVLIYFPAGNTLVSNIADGTKLAACEDVTTGKNEDGDRKSVV